MKNHSKLFSLFVIICAIFFLCSCKTSKQCPNKLKFDTRKESQIVKRKSKEIAKHSCKVPYGINKKKSNKFNF